MKAPAAAAASQPAATALAQRYGAARRKRVDRLAMLLGGGLLGALVVFFITAMLLNDAVSKISFSERSYQLGDTAVTLTFEVTRTDPALPVQCAVEAVSDSHAPVGYTIVAVPPALEPQRLVTTTVHTTLPAAAASVVSCWAQN